ncbi:hypothetical protein FB45DRAFT_1111866 [Roridomyces roridus]|uniref:Uncharacterized protein n=1 Tax=Roridomyces roridus TaxID=1738132 RepID=A0AAD7B8M5_9AGAR|nr:hypothetical protein FB45DRAFT_1111866 [Roridomyces roridus]
MSHRALCIPEIVAMICEDGVTCKAFQDPALNVLWRSQSTVVNVLKCMPGDIWQWEDEDPGQVTVSLSFLVQQLNQLRHLTVPCLDGPALDHLSQQSSLQCLTLLAQSALGISGIPSGELCDHRFPMKKLTVYFNDSPTVSGVLLRFRNRLLRDVTIRLPATTPARDVTQCYNTAAMVFREHPLSALSITCESSPATVHVAASPEQIALYAISATSLSPLFAISPTSVCLGPSVSILMTGQWLVLRLPGHAYCTSTSSPPCQMRFDATLIPQWQDQKPEWTRPHQKALTMLNLSDSRVGPPLAVAGFLSGLFPKLESVRYGRVRDPDTGALHDAWRKAVCDALPLLRDIRDEERYWTQRDDDREG